MSSESLAAPLEGDKDVMETLHGMPHCLTCYRLLTSWEDTPSSSDTTTPDSDEVETPSTTVFTAHNENTTPRQEKDDKSSADDAHDPPEAVNEKDESAASTSEKDPESSSTTKKVDDLLEEGSNLIPDSGEITDKTFDHLFDLTEAGRREKFAVALNASVAALALTEDRLRRLELYMAKTTADTATGAKKQKAEETGLKYKWLDKSRDKLAMDIVKEDWSDEQLESFYSNDYQPLKERLASKPFEDSKAYLTNALIILMDQPPASKQPLASKPGKHVGSRVLKVSDANFSAASPVPQDTTRLGRVILCAPQLVNEFSRVTTRADPWPTHLTILSPFKTLVYNDMAIRDHLETLQGNASKSVEDMVQQMTNEDENRESKLDEKIAEAAQVSVEPELVNKIKKDLESSAEEVQIIESSEIRKDREEKEEQRKDTAMDRPEHDQPTTKDQNLNSSTDTSPRLEARKRIAQAKAILPFWKCLIDFMDTDLAGLTALRGSISDGTVTHVEFEDVCHLFEPGTVVLQAGAERSQAYRVLQMIGGRRFLQSELLNIKNDAKSLASPVGTHSPYTIRCYYIAFDGKTFGPVQRDFVIPKYDGQQPITSLKIYPLAFHKSIQQQASVQQPSIMDQLHERGERYCKLSSAVSAVHKLYKGLSLDDPKEEVSSKSN
jgi:hypothetical protein